MTLSEVVHASDTVEQQMETASAYLRGKYANPAYVTRVPTANGFLPYLFRACVGMDFSYGTTVQDALGSLEIKLKPYLDNLLCRLCDEPVGGKGKLLGSPHGYGVEHEQCRVEWDEMRAGDLLNDSYHENMDTPMAEQYDGEGL